MPAATAPILAGEADRGHEAEGGSRSWPPETLIMQGDKCRPSRAADGARGRGASGESTLA